MINAITKWNNKWQIVIGNARPVIKNMAPGMYFLNTVKDAKTIYATHAMRNRILIMKNKT